MHDEILGDKKTKEFIDHIDGNGLNNQKKNLRSATRSENGTNRRKPKNNTSGIKGVYWKKDEQRWRIHFRRNGKLISSRRFKTIKDAECEYNRLSMIHDGAFVHKI